MILKNSRNFLFAAVFVNAHLMTSMNAVMVISTYLYLHTHLFHYFYPMKRWSLYQCAGKAGSTRSPTLALPVPCPQTQCTYLIPTSIANHSLITRSPQKHSNSIIFWGIPASPTVIHHYQTWESGSTSTKLATETGWHRKLKPKAYTGDTQCWQPSASGTWEH